MPPTKLPDPHNHFDSWAFRVTRSIGSPKSIVIHTIFFIGIFGLRFFGIAISDIFLFLTTVVSLEAIYLSLLIQMTVNINTAHLQSVSADVGEIQEDMEELQEDIGEIQEDVDEIQEDVEDIQEDVDEITEIIDENDNILEPKAKEEERKVKPIKKRVTKK
jgi:peptidoglycan hydrolase CwlO-like protein